MNRSPSKALITPSPSPSATRGTHAPRTVRGRGRPPKKPRLSQPPPTASEVIEARQASTSRLLDTWSQLAERYSLPVEEDDVVDLMTGEVVKDRGVLRSMPHPWEFGRFADEAGSEAGSSQVQNDDDSADELDTLPRNPSKQQQQLATDQEPEPETPIPPIQGKIRRVGALDPTNEEDAEDLRQFLEAEKLRKELCDSDIDQDDDSEQSFDGEESATPLVQDVERHEDSEDELAASIRYTDELVPLRSSPSRQLHTPPQSSSSSSLTPDVTEYSLTSSLPRVERPPPRCKSPSQINQETKSVRSISVPQEEPIPSTSRPSTKRVDLRSKTPATSNAVKDPIPSTSRPSIKTTDLRSKTPASSALPKRSTKQFRNDSPSKPVTPPTVKTTIVEVVVPRRSQSRSRDDLNNPVNSSMDKRGKQKVVEQAVDCEPDNASDDEIALGSEPVASSSRLPDVKQPNKLPKAASASLPIHGSSISSQTRKRKRISSSDTELSFTPEPSQRHVRHNSVSSISSDSSRHGSTRRSSHRRSKSARSRSRHSDSDSERESIPSRQRARSHFSAVPDPYFGYYPAPLEPPPQPHPFATLYHPQAQLIISNAMHQLSSLFSGQPYPPPQPYTPTKHSHHSSPYHTPRRQQGGSYYDPAYSHGTLPPSSPELDASPVRKSSHTSSRPSSLVSRSRSRGRKVSFRMEDGRDLVEVVDTQGSLERGRDRTQKAIRRYDDSLPVERGKGKAKAVPPPGDDDSPLRGRSFTRGQTPGPPTIRSGSSESPSKRSAKPRAKAPK